MSKKSFWPWGTALFWNIALIAYTQNFYQYIAVYLVLIWTYKNADEKAQTFSRRSKNVEKNGQKRTKNGYCVNSP